MGTARSPLQHPESHLEDLVLPREVLSWKCGNQLFMATEETSCLQPIHSQQACGLLDACGLSLEGAGGNQKAELYEISFTESGQVDPANAQHTLTLLRCAKAGSLAYGAACLRCLRALLSSPHHGEQ